jgi:hypothetical protein
MITLLLAPGVAHAATVKISKSKAIMEVDSTLKLKITGTDSKVTWSTSSKKIATVNSAGTVTAVQEGTATITAKVNSKKFTCTVTVVDSNKVVKKETFDPKKVASEIKVLNEYTWSTDYYNYIAIVIKNNSKFTVVPSIQLKLLDASGKTVGVKNDSEYAFGSGSEMVFIFSNKEEFTDYEYTISVSEEKYYKDVVSSLEVKTTTTDSKAIIEITNNGKIAAQFVEYSILYFRGDEVVDYGWGYCVDNDSEIKAGQTQFDEDTTYGVIFDSVKVYLTGRGK